MCMLHKWRREVFHCGLCRRPHLVCNNQNKLLQIKEDLSRKFEMKDLGELHFFLGMEVERNNDEQLLRINQIKYLKEILKRF